MVQKAGQAVNPPRIIFVNRFYFPDGSATSQILTELTTDLCADFSISVVTSRKLSNDPALWLPSRELINGVDVHRIWTTRLGHASLWRRAVDYLSFHVSLSWFLLRRVQPGDVVVLKTDPPLLQLFHTSLIRLKGGKVVNWLQDIYPEIAVRLGKFPSPRWLARAIAGWRDSALRAAVANVAISNAMAEYLLQRGLEKPHTIPNWADESLIQPVDHANNPLRKAWGLEGQFTVMYSGNFGRAHAFAEIAEAARQLAAKADIHFLFAGEGAGLGPLQQVLLESAANASFKPFQAREVLSHSLGVADLHLVSLKAGMEGLVMPSKVYGILAAGRPVVFIGEPKSELAALIEREQVGFAVGLGDGAGLAQQILALTRDLPRLKRYGINARKWFEREFTRAQAKARWRELLHAASAASASLAEP